MSRILRLAWPWGVLFCTGMTVRMLFDTFAPPAPTGYGPRSVWTSWFAIGTFFIAGLVGAQRSRSVGLGSAVAVAASVIGNLLAKLPEITVFMAVIRHDAQMLHTFEMTGGWDEGIGLPIVMIPFVAVIGLTGGLTWLGSTRVARSRPTVT